MAKRLKREMKKMLKYDYFEWYFIALRALGFGKFTKPKEDRLIRKNGIDTFENSNFDLGYLARSFFPLFLMIAVPIFEVWEFINLLEKKEDVVKSLMFTAVHVVMMGKFLMYFLKGHNMKMIAYLIEIEAKKYSQDYKLINKTRMMTNQMLCAGYIGVLIVAAMANYHAISETRSSNNISNNSANLTVSRNYVLPFKLKIPFRLDDDFRYGVAVSLQTLGVSSFGIMFFAADGFIFSGIMQVVTQLKILKNSLRFMDLIALKKLAKHKPVTRIEKLHSEKSETCYRLLGVQLAQLQDQVEKDLLQNIKHHQLIIRCANLIEDTYTIGFFAHLFSGWFSLALGMSALVAEGNQEKAMVVHYLFAMLLEQGFLCWAGTELSYQSGEITTALMSSRWYLYSVTWRRTACMISSRAQRPLVITAGKFIDLNYNSLLKTVKAAYSYYTVMTRKRIN